MARFLILWEIDSNRAPENPKERGEAWDFLVNIVKHDMEEGPGVDWGAFVGSDKGFSIAEGSELDINIMVQQYYPFVKFKTYPIATLNQTEEMINTLKSL